MNTKRHAIESASSAKNMARPTGPPLDPAVISLMHPGPHRPIEIILSQPRFKSSPYGIDFSQY
jgi:hypothetical protein